MCFITIFATSACRPLHIYQYNAQMNDTLTTRDFVLLILDYICSTKWPTFWAGRDGGETRSHLVNLLIAQGVQGGTPKSSTKSFTSHTHRIAEIRYYL